MQADKRKKLDAKGWKVGNAADFLELSQEEAAYLDFKISLSRNLRDIRKKKRWSQVDLAKAIGSSQSRVAKKFRSVPETSFTDHTGHMVYSSGTKGFVVGSTRPTSSSKNPRS